MNAICLNYRLHTNKQCKQSEGGADVIMSKFNNPKSIIKCAQNIGCTHVQCVSNHSILKIVSEYDQEIPQSQTADNPIPP